MKSLHIDLMAESWVNGGLQDEKGYPFGLSDEDKIIWEKIKDKWTLTDGRWINQRLEDEREKKTKFIDHQVENGKKGGRPKKPNENPSQNPTETQAFSEIEAKKKPLVNANAINSIKTLEEKKDSPEPPPKEPLGSEAVSAIARLVWSDQKWKEMICMGNNIKNFEDLSKWMAKFNASVCNDEIKNFDQGSYKKMIQGWIVSQKSRGVSVSDIAIERSSNSAPLQKFQA